MFESRKNFGLGKEVPKKAEDNAGLTKLIADIKARIDNGTHVPEDAKLLERYEQELAEKERNV